jgi:choline dehydrogenase
VRRLKGPHPITRVTEGETGKIQKAFVEGSVESGFQNIHDLNAAGAEGVAPSPMCR